MICIILQFIFGILSAISPIYSLFLATRFVLALANGGTVIISFVLCMEVVSGKWRTIVPILYQIPFGIGNTIMALLAYFIKEWRELQLVLSSLSAVFLVYIWWVKFRKIVLKLLFFYPPIGSYQNHRVGS